jgi:uncharacterized protein (DUF2267 family)
VPVKLGREEFLERVRREFRYDDEIDVFQLTQTVLGALREHITDGEWQDIRSTLPSELVAILSQGR